VPDYDVSSCLTRALTLPMSARPCSLGLSADTTLPISLIEEAPAYQRLDLGLAQCSRKIGLPDSDVALLLGGEILASALAELLHGLARGTHLLLDDRDDLRVIESDPLVHLASLDRGEQHADCAKARRVLGTHGLLHVLVDPVLERHGRDRYGSSVRSGRPAGAPMPARGALLSGPGLGGAFGRTHAHDESAHGFLLLALDRGRSLALANGSRLFVMLAPTHLGKHACLLARTAEAAQRDLKRLVVFNPHRRHAIVTSSRRIVRIRPEFPAEKGGILAASGGFVTAMVRALANP